MLRIDVENEFASCVRKVGGVILVDELGPSPSFANADYLFREHDVVAELKCMERDTRTEGPFLEKITQMQWSWVQSGLIPPPPPGSKGRLRVNSSNLPIECTKQILELLKNRLQRLVKKANKQIEQTKSALDLPDAKGLLVLANDGDMIFEFEGILHLLDRILKRRFHHINTVLYFTANYPVSGPNLPFPAQIWTDLVIDDGGVERPGVARPILDKLGKGWFNHIADIVGGPTLTVNRSGETPDRVAAYRFTRDEP
ncbi:MAG: hypothetical protein ACE37H_01780 [Phycisphaeraceae bacterium]